jgi:hypothetical protein
MINECSWRGVLPLLSLCCILLLQGCLTKGNTIYRYSDGSGNTYVFRNSGAKFLEYHPVKPHRSSSGLYDGGDHIKREMSESQYHALRSALRSAIDRREAHINERVKGSGLIVIQCGDRKAAYIIKPDSEEQLRIERILRDTIK